jgi:ATP-binding cassette subfamily B protein
MPKYAFQKQHDTIDCGPSCLKMIADYYGKNYSLEYLREQCFISREGVSIVNINDAAEKLGFKTVLAKINLDQLEEDCPLPCILHWNQDHFIVLYAIKNERSIYGRSKKGAYKFVVADPAHEIVEVDIETFRKLWISSEDEKGVGLFLEPTPEFYSKDLNTNVKEESVLFLLKYLLPYKKYIFQLIIGMIAASVFSLLFPFLTQLLIDIGVNEKKLSIVYLIFASQIFLFVGSVGIDLIRNWLLLHINARISLHIISDFLIKLLRLPIKYFDTKAVGDLSQRIQDHHRIESFLTGSLLSSVFSVINIIVFAVVLGFYSPIILSIFIVLSTLGLLWIFLFQGRRKNLDYKRFSTNRENQDKIFEMITGMQEIKLFGAENSTRWKWEQLQVRFFKLNIETLTLEQHQQTGYIFLTHLKNILISFFSVYCVINDRLSLGALLSISYIIGQTNGPIDQLVGFIKGAQDAKLSMSRLQEIHLKEDEENLENATTLDDISSRDFNLKNVSFQYEGPHSPKVLDNISLTIPEGKITAIVGSSGSGKTTLMKLLLSFYEPSSGVITIGNTDMSTISPTFWRGLCGTVMQEGYIFNDTIENNIALDGKEVDKAKLANAVVTANLQEFVSALPLGFNTKIGNSGVGISGGQKQRILIARAVYKNPDYIFFDEATSSLDANNEKIIIDNLNHFFHGKTVVIIAHRLSTVKNADQILMLENGKIIEQGTHDSLCVVKGKYFELVKNQLELAE